MFMTIDQRPRLSSRQGRYIWTMDHALDVAGVDAETKAKQVKALGLKWAAAAHG
ncbi:hypothetical protein K443DRAFT_12349 [Laccaria amethystina LaAM-08-1]|uniref:Unplaced genomic scaffold K443scaffold_272, whole genome shotgun sequence n=1 Tax=Laccaria amethystina LaAM-08-1 TaxID=1095629 RepID=A0A0C9X913_9AGAR|nr:hypothetical protein K443DRAFT_12349 [Laccaria amethystina LaAM-08-1]